MTNYSSNLSFLVYKKHAEFWFQGLKKKVLHVEIFYVLLTFWRRACYKVKKYIRQKIDTPKPILKMTPTIA